MQCSFARRQSANLLTRAYARLPGARSARGLKHSAKVSHSELQGCPSEAIIGHVPVAGPPSAGGMSGGPMPDPEPHEPTRQRVRLPSHACPDMAHVTGWQVPDAEQPIRAMELEQGQGPGAQPNPGEQSS